jgi:hypothetical protein
LHEHHLGLGREGAEGGGEGEDSTRGGQLKDDWGKVVGDPNESDISQEKGEGKGAALLAVLHRDLQRDYQQGATQGGNDPADSDSCLLRSVTDSLYSEYNGYSLVEKLMAVISESFAPQGEGWEELRGGVRNVTALDTSTPLSTEKSVSHTHHVSHVQTVDPVLATLQTLLGQQGCAGVPWRVREWGEWGRGEEGERSVCPEAIVEGALLGGSLAGMHPPPHMTCMYPPPHMTCMYPPPHLLGGSLADCYRLLLSQHCAFLADFLKRRGCSNVGVSPWKELKDSSESSSDSDTQYAWMYC